jgi:hypothetical protein
MRFAALLLAFAAVCACRRPIPTAEKTHGFPDKPPVIDAQPVDAKSYDAGFKSGYAAGAAAGRPGAKLPERDVVLQLADTALADEPVPNKKWRDGWANGYLESFRTRAQHTK